MKIGIKILLGISFFLSVSAKSQTTDTCQEKGTIISFNPDKCYGCWGWTIALDTGTIKTDDLNGHIFGYEFTEPMRVRVTVGQRKTTGSGKLTMYHEVLCARKEE